MRAFESYARALKDKPQPIPNRTYSLALLVILNEAPCEVTFTEIYRVTSLSKPGFAVTLKSLVKRGYAKKDESGFYTISEKGQEYLKTIDLSVLNGKISPWMIDFLIGLREINLGKPIRNLEERKELGEQMEESLYILIGRGVQFVKTFEKNSQVLKNSLK